MKITQKLGLNKQTLKNMKIQSNIKAGKPPAVSSGNLNCSSSCATMG